MSEEISAAERFVKFDFVETKDLCKQFLTLISGLLVFSVTFSEKIIDANSPSLKARIELLSSWVLFLFAIIGAGCGLWLIFVAGSAATHHPHDLIRRKRLKGLSYLTLDLWGICFVAGLVLLILSALSRFM